MVPFYHRSSVRSGMIPVEGIVKIESRSQDGEGATGLYCCVCSAKALLVLSRYLPVPITTCIRILVFLDAARISSACL